MPIDMEPKSGPVVPTAVNEGDYADATESYTGWCTTCKEFTREHTEPDAEGYKCPVCDGLTVIGAEDALLLGHITFKENADGD
jgi:Zn finger protein HypA/HybF involved in hydrogenase expression